MPADNMNLQDASAHEDVPAHYIRRRHLIVALLMMGNFVSYCLRMSMSTAAQKPRKSGEGSEDETLSTEFNWSDFQLGVALGAFYAGYLFLQIPVKWMLRYISAKHIFALGILGASTMTLITPICASQYWLLILVRFCTGLAEGVTYPSMAHLIVSWSPLQERTRALAITSSGAYLGTAAALPTSGYVLSSLGWRAIFYIYGILGLVWITVWMTAGAESPEAHKSINPGEAAYILATRDCGKKSQSSLPTFPPHRCINSSTTTNNNKGKRKSIQNLIDRAADGDGSLIDVKSSSPLVGNQNAHGSSSSSSSSGNMEGDSSASALLVGSAPTDDSVFVNPHLEASNEDDDNHDDATLLPKGMSWWSFLTHPATRVCLAGSWSYCWIFYTMLSEYPSYASSVLNMSVSKAGASAVGAYMLLWGTTTCTGWISDYIIAQNMLSRLQTRKATYLAGMLPASAMLAAVGYVDSVDGAIVLITLAIGIAGVSFSGVWTHVLDVSGEHSALLYATANVAATVPGFVSPLLVGLFLEVAGEKQGWRLMFLTSGFVGCVGSAIFAFGATSTVLAAPPLPS